jgi:hypothetical protein
MASTAQKRDVLNFEPSLEYTIALKYETGRQISNGRIMFTTVEGEVFFIDQEDADKIYELQLRPQEPFKLVKQGRNGISVERIAGRQATEPPAAPAIRSFGVESDTASQAQNTSLSGIMAASYISAIDALVIAEQYAQKKGVAFKITTGEIRSSAHCIYISMTKNGVAR